MINFAEKKFTCRSTYMFREKNLYSILERLKEDPKKQKYILLVGTSFEELFTIRLYAIRLGLDQYYFIGVNNLDEEILRTYKLLLTFERDEDDFKRNYEGIMTKYLTQHDLINLSDYFILNRIEKDRDGNDFKHYKLSNKFLDGIIVLEGDILNQNFRYDGGFDATICNNVLVHFNEKERELAWTHLVQSTQYNGLVARDQCNTRYDYALSNEDHNTNIEQTIQKIGSVYNNGNNIYVLSES
jgi:hypothetical protein